MEEEAVTKLTGRLVWLDSESSEFVDRGDGTRIILRRDALVMDVARGHGPYSIHLRRISDSTFKGSWSCRSGRAEETGVADCTLVFKDDHVLLHGGWNRSQCMWFGYLERVEGF